MLLFQVVLSADGTAAQLVSKYRPPCPVVVVSDSEAVLRGLAGYYALYPCKVGPMLQQQLDFSGAKVHVVAAVVHTGCIMFPGCRHKLCSPAWSDDLIWQHCHAIV